MIRLVRTVFFSWKNSFGNMIEMRGESEIYRYQKFIF